MLSVLVFHLLGPLQISAMAVVVCFTAYRLHLTSSVFCLYHLFLFRVSLEATKFTQVLRSEVWGSQCFRSKCKQIGTRRKRIDASDFHPVGERERILRHILHDSSVGPSRNEPQLLKLIDFSSSSVVSPSVLILGSSPK